MKPQTFFRLALSTPFILWVIFLVISFVFAEIEMPYPLPMVFAPIMFYVIGAIFWVLPYLILAVGLWVWSKERSTQALQAAALMAPVIFSTLLLLEIGLIYLLTDNITELADTLLELILFLGGFSLVFGYFCVGIAFGVFKVLQKDGKVALETTTQA